MKKFISGLIIGILLTSSTFAATLIKEAYYNSDIKIRVNGQYVQTTPITVIDEGQTNGRNFTSVRDIAEAMGGTVYWNGDTGTIDIVSQAVESKYVEPEKPKEKTVEEIAENVNATVKIKIYDNFNYENNTADTVGNGSGVVIMDGIIVTNYHVLIGDRLGIEYSNFEEGREVRTSSYICGDETRDIAAIAVNYKSPGIATIGNSDELKIGQKVVAIGSPQGLKNTVSEGIISGFRTIDGQKFIQTTAAISKGSSGGGLYNMNGELIGITSLKNIDGESLNFAIPINDVLTLINKSDSQLKISLFNVFKMFAYSNRTYSFNYYSFLENNVFNVWFYLGEDWEGASDFIQAYEGDRDFMKLVTLKAMEIESILKKKGYKNFSIIISSKEKSVYYLAKDGNDMQVEGITFNIK